MIVHIPNMPLKVAFFVHLILSVWATLGSWLPSNYLLYNGLVLLAILWTINSRDSEEGPFMGVCINSVAILLDIMCLILFWPSKVVWASLSRFGAVCAIGNLILRPVSIMILYRIFRDRAGTYGNFVMPTGLDNMFAGRRGPYEDLDQPGNTGNGGNTRDASQNILGSPDSIRS